MPCGYERRLIDVGGQQMCVTTLGAGRPVLMVHGNPTWSFLYRKIAIDLSGEELMLVMPDLIGLGYSDKPRDPAQHTLDNHGRWMSALVEQLDLRGVILMVQDWGGPIGVLGLQQRPDQLAGMVVLNTVLSPPKPGFKATLFHRFARLPVVSNVAFEWLGLEHRLMSVAQGDKSSIRGEVARAYHLPLRQRRDRVAPLALARMVPDSQNHPSIADLRRVQETVEAFGGPAEIVWGNRDPVLGSVRNWIAKLLPQAQVTETQAGHFLQEEVPELIADATRRVATALNS